MKKLLFAFVAFAASLVVLAVGLPSQLMGWANSSAGEGWDGTVTTSLDDVTMKSVSEFEGVTLKFNGATSIEVNSIEEDGETLYGMFEAWNPDYSEYYIWSPYYGGTWEVNGDEITLKNWFNANDFGVKQQKKIGKKAVRRAPEGDTEYQFEMMDYGETFIIDGEVYEDQIDLFFNAKEGDAPAEPFIPTSVSNNGVDGNVMSAVEASENGVSRSFVLTAAGKTLSKGTAEATLSKMENAPEFGAATVTVDGDVATISFNSLNKSFFTQAGTYVLSIPEGVVVDENDAPNTALALRWVIIEGEEPVVTGLVNADFAEGVVGDVNIATYAKDGPVNQMQPVFDWNFGVANDDARAAGVVAYGSGTTLGGSDYTVPAAGPEGTNGNALAMVGVWSGTVQYVQDIQLTAGKYTMTVPVYNTKGTQAFVKNLIGVKIGETENYAATTSYAVGKWIDETVVFELEEETTVTVSLGYEGANVGSGASQHLFIDCVKIEAYDELAVAKAAAIAALPAGNESIFTPAAEDVEAAKAAIEAAASVEDLEALVAAIDLTAPALSGEWMIKNANGEFYLGEAKLSDAPVAVTFEAVEGGYAIKMGEVYVNMAGNNNWSMNTGEAATTAWNFNLADGKYTIQGPKGLIGTDNLEDGAATYGDKKTSNNGYWTIAEYVAPIEITPALILGAEEITLNSHSAVSVVEAGAIKVQFENGAAIKTALYQIEEVVEGEEEEGEELAYGLLSLNNFGYAEFEDVIKFEQGKQYAVRIMAWDGEDLTANPVATYECLINGAYVAPIEITPALILGEEEITLNSHSAVSVDMAEAIKVQFENGAAIKTALYQIEEVVAGEEEEGEELAYGLLSMNSFGYAEFEEALHFEKGKQYAVRVMAWDGEDLTAAPVATYECLINGSYSEEAEIEVALVANADTEYTISTGRDVTVDVPVTAIKVTGLDQITDEIHYAIYSKTATVAEGILSVNTIGYAEFEAPVTLESGVKYNVVLTANEETIYEAYVIGAADVAPVVEFWNDFALLQDGAEIDLAETKSINVNVQLPDGIEADADLYIEGVLVGKDGTNQPIFGFTDFEDGVDVAISRLTPGNAYQIQITKIAYGEVVDVDEETYMPIYENQFVAEEGEALATLNFAIAKEEASEIGEIVATYNEASNVIDIIFQDQTDVAPSWNVDILLDGEKLNCEMGMDWNEIYGYPSTTLAEGEHTIVFPAGSLMLNSQDVNAVECSVTFTVGEGAEMAVIPAFVAGEEEITLNDHSAVTVEYAEALKVNFENMPEVIGATYAINEMKMGEDEDGIFWHVGAEVAAGELSVNTIGYAEFEDAINFKAGKKYQLTVTPFQNAEDPQEMESVKFEFNGAYVEYADVYMVITEAKYATFYAPFEVTVPEGVTAYTIPGLSDGTKLTMAKIKDGVIPANTPVVVYSENVVEKGYNGIVEENENAEEGLLTGVLEATEAPVGSYVLQSHEDGNKVGFFQVEDGVKVEVAANRAYLTAPASDVKAYYLNDATAIKALESLMAGKAQIYDLNGRQQSKLQKGINIVNGVKVLVK